jgi:hypothetical protein
MQRRIWIARSAAALLLLATAAFAHHSLGATYDDSREVKLEGKIAQFLMRNPHSFLHIEAPDETGAMRRWSLEWRSAGSLSASGFKRDTFQVGDEVTITMSPSRTAADYRGVLKTLHRKRDGFGWGDKAGESVE